MSITDLNKPTAESLGWGDDVNDNFTDVENLAKGTETAEAIAVDNLKLDGNTLSSTDTNGNINVTPDGTGKVVLDGLNWPTADGSANQVIETDGSGNLSFSDHFDGGDQVLLTTATASSDATIEFTSGLDSTYKRYVVEIIDVAPASDNKELRMRVSTDGGSTWKSGSSDYTGIVIYVNTTGSGIGGESDTTRRLRLSRWVFFNQHGLSNSSADSYSATLQLNNPASSSVEQTFYWAGRYRQASNKLCAIDGAGRYNASSAIDGLQFYMSSGNISSGTFKLYGMK